MEDFNFPLEPYDVQMAFSKALYAALEGGKIGIFESPTGTGKSLSVICGALKWLADLKASRMKCLLSEMEQLEAQIQEPASSTNWLEDLAHKAHLKERLQELRLQCDRIVQREDKFEKLKRGSRSQNLSTDSAVELSSVRQTISQVQDEQILEDYESADESIANSVDEANETQIIYCSRTHSQLSQFVKELKRTVHSESTRSVCLGSRQNMCINNAVKKLRTLNLMNEKCLEMQKKVVKSGSQRKCPFYKQQAMQACSENILVESKDIEDIVETGQKLGACPYYSARYSVSDAELILVPYTTLLQKSTRDACNLRLRGSVIIIDEAHNLLETINASHSIEVSSCTLSEADTLLSTYLTKYRSRLNGKNVMYVKQIIHIVKAFNRYLNTLEGTKCCYPQHLLAHLKLEHFNLVKIVRYFKESRIALKLQTLNGTSEADGRRAPVLVCVHQFLAALSCCERDGRLLCSGEASSIKYLHLNPAAQFKDIVSQAHALILAGGTMQPTSEFVDQLLVPAGADEKRLTYFSCGHVVPKSSLLAVVLAQGPTLSFHSRQDPKLMDELGRQLLDVCAVVPGGVVCFFPSYDYQTLVQDTWNKSGMLGKLRAKKEIFCEPRKASQVDKCLAEYAQCISGSKGGALLFAVVGGKMSEGINFSDDMGRCVVMVGMPYANIQSAEMKEKMTFLNKRFGNAPDGRPAGQVYYDNVCMKAVNQSIGRAIRHKGDFASILFLDQRYQRPAVIKALPAWIRESVREHQTFASALTNIREFFANRCKTIV